MPVSAAGSEKSTGAAGSVMMNATARSPSSGNGTAGNNRHYGMTAPISLAGPEAKDKELTDKLVESMMPHGCYESEEETNHRVEVMGKLVALVKELKTRSQARSPCAGGATITDV